LCGATDIGEDGSFESIVKTDQGHNERLTKDLCTACMRGELIAALGALPFMERRAFYLKQRSG